MAFRLDPEIARALARRHGLGGLGELHEARAAIDEAMARIDACEPESPHVRRQDHTIDVLDGQIAARWYSHTAERPGSAVVYAHGGGMFSGSMAVYDRVVARYVEETGVPFLSVDYRRAPERTGTSLVDDVFAGVRWLHDHAAALGVDSLRIAVAGDSAGGGIAAGVAIAARDAGIHIAHQVLIYPMLDDRTTVDDPALAPFATWTYAHNSVGWDALLGPDRHTDIAALSAPARLATHAGLAPAYIDVGELDIFRDESVAYAMGLWRAGVSAELIVRAGCPHDFDRIDPGSRVARESWADRFRVIRSL